MVPAMLLLGATCALADPEPPGLLGRFLERIAAELGRQTDYSCSQDIERFQRSSPEGPWKKRDSLAFLVALAGGKEYYSLPGETRFQDRPLADLVGHGTISTGQFALLAHHVFVANAARITYRGASERRGRAAHEYEYDVPEENSGYHLRMGSQDAIVAFNGTFHIDAETLDLLELEVQAYDIPDRIGLAHTSTRLTFARVQVGDDAILLPTAATLEMGDLRGLENLNRGRLHDCRRFSSNSLVRFAGEDPAPAKPSAAQPPPQALPAGAVLELSLSTDLDPSLLKPGDSLTARLLRSPFTSPAARVLGSVVRIVKQSQPFPLYELGFEFNRLETETGTLPFTATMIDIEKASGVLAQTRTLDPKFDRRSKPRLDVLVREVQQGQGILLWDARRAKIPRGLRMKWRVLDEHLEPAARLNSPAPPK